MNAAETIQAAIDRLTELRDAADRAPWEMTDLEPHGHKGVVWIESRATGSRVVVEFDRKIGNQHIHENARLIVTLHRTIDPQLAILRSGLRIAELMAPVGDEAAADWASEALALAEAILGGAE